MSDELRGPTSNIVQLVRLLRTDQCSNTLDLLEGTASRLLILMNSYLDIVKLTGDGIALENHLIDVQHMVRCALSPSLPSVWLSNILCIYSYTQALPKM
jgi:signal transduction histidine kinase